MPSKSKPLVINGNLKLPTELQPWERELLLPLMLEATKDAFGESSSAAPVEPLNPKLHPAEDQFLETCRQQGVKILGRRMGLDGSVVFACRVQGVARRP
jgi:hypothetical protein